MTGILVESISIREDIPWEVFIEELMDLDLFPYATLYGSPTHLVIDLCPEGADKNKLLIEIYKRRPDLVCVRISRRGFVIGRPLLDVYLRRTCDAIQRLAGNYGSAEDRIRTARG